MNEMDHLKLMVDQSKGRHGWNWTIDDCRVDAIKWAINEIERLAIRANVSENREKHFRAEIRDLKDDNATLDAANQSLHITNNKLTDVIRDRDWEIGNLKSEVDEFEKQQLVELYPLSKRRISAHCWFGRPSWGSEFGGW